MMVPILDEVIAEAAEAGIRQILIGMAHRGRLNVMAHVLGKPYAQILAEFKDPVRRGNFRDDMAWTGDVKYHWAPTARSKAARRWISSSRCRRTRAISRRSIRCVEGMARAAGTSVDGPGAPTFDPTQCADSDSRRCGVPRPGHRRRDAESQPAPGYIDGRHDSHHRQQPARVYDRTRAMSYSTLYASGLARGFKIPIVHVNADDPRSLRRGRRAWRSRIASEFQRDFLIDLVGYRRYGHNEGDEPAFTQPVMYQKIAWHPTVREIWASSLDRARRHSKRRSGRHASRRAPTRCRAAYDSLQPGQDLVEPMPEAPPPVLPPKAKTSRSDRTAARAEQRRC